MPDFGVTKTLSEFGKAVKDKRFRHPQTGNKVLFKSLPKEERHRLYEQWKNGLSSEDSASAPGKKKPPKKPKLLFRKRRPESGDQIKAEKARKEAVREMGKTGKPLRDPKTVAVGDVVSYHRKGEVHHGRVIDARGHEFFTIDIDPETGKVRRHGFRGFRGADLHKRDAHKVDEKHVPPDPSEENEKELYEALPKLKENPSLYFQNPPGTQLVELSKIQPAKVRLKGVLNGNELLELAAQGKYGKRSPISLIDDGTGVLKVRDGNSTYTNASLSAWKKIPAVVKTPEEWEEHEKKQQQKALFQQPKVTKKPAPKKKPQSFAGKPVQRVEDLEEDAFFGYRHKGRWYVGQVVESDGEGQVVVDSLHPENGKLTTLKYIPFDDGALQKSDAVLLPSDFFERGKKASALRRAFLRRLAYRPLWQDTPGYKTLVDDKSTKGILPSQLEDSDLSQGQSNLDAMWPVAPGEAREKERALPLPSNHSEKRDKRIGPTTYNKPRKIPYRTLDVPGDEYGHPTKYDYNMPTRRTETLASEDEVQESTAAARQGPFPKRPQRSQSGDARVRSKQWYLRNPSHKRKMRMKYRLRDKRLPREKLKDKYYRQYPHRYKRRGIGVTTPAQRSREWREKKKIELREKGRSRSRRAGLEALAQAFELLGGNWPAHWNTQVKKTKPPEQLDQNYGKGQSRQTGTPRKNPEKQQGESLRAPDLPAKPQKGLKWEVTPPAPGGLNYPAPTTMNPTDGSGKVLPMSYYTDMANNTQEIPSGREDRYLHNNNFDVKQAATVSDILKRCDRKIVERSREYTPKLVRTDTKNWIWHWKVGKHTVRVQAYKRGNASSFPKLNLRVSCSCPFWKWWGPAHWATQNEYQKGRAPGSASYPEVRDPEHWRPVCKHAYAVLESSQKFFVRPRKSPLKKLGSRFSVDRETAVGAVNRHQDIRERQMQRVVERALISRVARRYLERKEP